MTRHVSAPEECPVCGATVPRGARACPECGADERSGWNTDDTRYDGLDLPDEAFEAPGTHAPQRAARVRAGYLWPVVAGLLVLALIIAFVFRR